MDAVSMALPLAREMGSSSRKIIVAFSLPESRGPAWCGQRYQLMREMPEIRLLFMYYKQEMARDPSKS
jgi:hypothetical protein